MPFKVIFGRAGYWDPPRSDAQNEDATEEEPKSPRASGRFRVNQPWLDKEWGKTADLVPVGGKRRRSAASEDPMDATREMMAAMRKPGAGESPLVQTRRIGTCRASSRSHPSKIRPAEQKGRRVVARGIARAIERRCFFR